jgi:hypothetical protein
LAEAENLLNDYDARFLVNKIQVNIEVDEILGYTSEIIRTLDRIACFEKAFVLAQFSASLQKEINRQSARLKWSQHNLNLVVAKEYNNYGSEFVKYEVKVGMVCHGNDYAKILYRIILDAETKIEEFSFLAGRVGSMSDILKELGKSKRD